MLVEELCRGLHEKHTECRNERARIKDEMYPSHEQQHQRQHTALFVHTSQLVQRNNVPNARLWFTVFSFALCVCVCMYRARSGYMLFYYRKTEKYVEEMVQNARTSILFPLLFSRGWFNVNGYLFLYKRRCRFRAAFWDALWNVRIATMTAKGDAVARATRVHTHSARGSRHCWRRNGRHVVGGPAGLCINSTNCIMEWWLTWTSQMWVYAICTNDRFGKMVASVDSCATGITKI